MVSQAYDPYLKTAMAPGNASNGHSGATIDLLGDDIKIALVDTTGGYTVDDEHDYIADLSTHIVSNGQSGNLASKALVDISGGGVAFDAADLTGGSAMTNVGDGTETIGAIVLYDDTVASDPLIVYIDSGTGFGVLPNASTIEVTWDSGNNRIFSFGA